LPRLVTLTNIMMCKNWSFCRHFRPGNPQESYNPTSYFYWNV